MFKLFPIICSLLVVSITAFPNVQLLVPENSYAIVSSGKSSGRIASLGSSSLSNAVDDDNTGAAGEAAGNGNAGGAYGDASQSSGGDASASSSSGASSSSSSSARSSGLSSSSRSYGHGLSIQHHVLPAETLPLPLTIHARPGLRTVIAPETITIHQPTVAKIGEVVQKIPTAVSHQSQSIVHKHARVVTPIVAPAVRTFTSQLVRAYHTPLIYGADGSLGKSIH